jgi:hypothetical protein
VEVDAEVGVTGGAEHSAEPGSAPLAGPSGLAALDPANVMLVETLANVVLLPEVGVDRFSQFLPGYGPRGT